MQSYRQLVVCAEEKSSQKSSHFSSKQKIANSSHIFICVFNKDYISLHG